MCWSDRSLEAYVDVAGLGKGWATGPKFDLFDANPADSLANVTQ